MSSSASTSSRKTKLQVPREFAKTTLANMYLEKRPMWQIAKKLETSEATCYRMLKEVKADWIQSAVRDFSVRQAEELQAVDKLEKEYWDAWKRSQAAQKSTQDTTEAGVLAKTVKSKAKRDGSTVFLSGIQWCIEQRCKILGLHAPKEMRVEQFTAGAEVSKMSDGELEGILKRNGVSIEAVFEEVANESASPAQ